MPAAEHGKMHPRLVIFGAGYIGGAVARAAVARGYEVTALTRNSERAAELQVDGIRTVVADLAGEAWLGEIPAGADYVLNCVSSGGGGLDGYRRSYVDGTARIAAWTQRGRVGTLVYTSSTSVYPQGGGVEVNESAPTEPASERAAILLEAERLSAAANANRVFVLRLAGIYGPDRHMILDTLRAGGPLPGSGAHRLNLAHRDDIVAANLACFAAPPAVNGGVFNVADDHPAARAEVAAWLAAKLGLPPPSFDPGATSGRRRPETPDRLIRNGRLKSTLGWRPQYPDFRAGYESLMSP